MDQPSDTNTPVRLLSTIALSVFIHLAALMPVSSADLLTASGPTVIQMPPPSALAKIAITLEPEASTTKAVHNFTDTGAVCNTKKQAKLPGELIRPVELPPVLRTAPTVPSGSPFGDHQGFVVFELTIDIEGIVITTNTLDTNLSDEHLEVVKEHTRDALFYPARRGNHPVVGKTAVRFEYHPQEPDQLKYQWIPDYHPDAG